MTTYIQLLNKIETFCDAHYQIQRYGGEFREQMPNLSTESEKYPIVFVTPTNGVPMYDTNQISLDIYCVDIIQKGRENLNTILSDCHLILTDLYGYFSQGSDLSVDVIGQPSQEPLNNLDLDYVAGWKMTIVFEVDGYCVDAIPMGTIPSGGGECQDATYTITDDAGNTLYSGSITSGGSLVQEITDSTAVLKDSAGSTISTTSINAQASADITAPDGNITLNSVAMSTVESGGTENILVLQSNDMTQVGSKQGTHWRIDDSNVTNSDGSYDVNVKAEDSLVLPDSQINVNSVSQGNVVSVKTVDVNIQDSGGVVTPDSVSLVGNTLTVTVPAGSAAPVGATLMKTGQTTSYRTGDDGDLEAGRATDFFTLGTNNPFGNTNRFTDELGGTTYTNNIVIDWSTYDNIGGTVLGYYRRLLSSGAVFDFNWNDAIDLALSHSVGTFTTGWRMWNERECLNIANFGLSNVYNYSPFDNASGGQLVGQNIWTSTTLAVSTTNAIHLPNSGYGLLAFFAKTNTRRVTAVRTFTVTGTTLS